jgi:hypothetical protein
MALWDRQEGESTKAYRAFCIFRDLGPARTLVEAARRYGVEQVEAGKRNARGSQRANRHSPGYIQRWYTRYHWRERAEAWDDVQDLATREVRLKARLQAIEDMEARQVQRAILMQELATRWYLNLLEQVQRDPAAIDRLGPEEARRLFLEAAALERVARGEPSQVVQTNGGAAERERERLRDRDVRHLTDEELKRIAGSALDDWEARRGGQLVRPEPPAAEEADAPAKDLPDGQYCPAGDEEPPSTLPISHGLGRTA